MTTEAEILSDTRPVSMGALASLMQTLSHAIGKRINSRTANLEARVAALEERAPLGYAGTWRLNEQSTKGYFYTDHGSIWFCKSDTLNRPGEDPSAWQLACKRGSDGKDLR